MRWRPRVRPSDDMSSPGQGREHCRSARTRRACGSTAGCVAAIPICRRPISTRIVRKGAAKSGSTAKRVEISTRLGDRPAPCACPPPHAARKEQALRHARPRRLPETPRDMFTCSRIATSSCSISQFEEHLAVQWAARETKAAISTACSPGSPDQNGERPGAGASGSIATRPGCSLIAKSRRNVRRISALTFALARRKEDLLGGGRGDPQAGEGPHFLMFLAKGEAMGRPAARKGDRTTSIERMTRRAAMAIPEAHALALTLYAPRSTRFSVPRLPPGFSMRPITGRTHHHARALRGWIGHPIRRRPQKYNRRPEERSGARGPAARPCRRASRNTAFALRGG